MDFTIKKTDLVLSIFKNLPIDTQVSMGRKKNYFQYDDPERTVLFHFEVKKIKRNNETLVEPYIQVVIKENWEFVNKNSQTFNFLTFKYAEMMKYVISQSISFFTEKEGYQNWHFSDVETLEDTVKEISEIIYNICNNEISLMNKNYFINAYENKYKKISNIDSFIFNICILYYLLGNKSKAKEICDLRSVRTNSDFAREAFLNLSKIL